MAELMQFVALTTVLCCFLPTMITADLLGDWGEAEYCPEGEVAIGFSLKTERDQGDGDQTALNSISLKCLGGSWIYSAQGPRGKWGENFICAGGWLMGCALRVHPIQEKDFDNVAATNMNCWCSNTQTLEGDGLYLGDMQDWSKTCASIVGLQTRVQKDQGAAGDDTSLNDVKFLCKHP